MDLEEIRKIAIPACREFDVRRLDVFGSFARGEAKPASDIDFLVEFEDPARRPSKRFFGLLHYLEDRFGRQIDLVTADALKNPYFRRRVLRERVTLYEG